MSDLPPGVEIRGYTFRVVDWRKYAAWGRKRTQDTGGSEDE